MNDFVKRRRRHLDARGIAQHVATAAILAMLALGCAVEGVDGGSAVIVAGTPATVETINTCVAGGVLLKGGYSGDIKLLCDKYLIDGGVVFKKGSVSIAAGTTFVVADGGSLWIESDSAIVAKGTKDKPIVIRGDKTAMGLWKVFAIESADPDNALHFVEVRGAGSATHYTTAKAGLYLKNKAKLNLANCTFADNGGSHVYVENDVTLTGFLTNTFGPQDLAAMTVYTQSAGALDAGSDFGPDGNVVVVQGKSAEGDATWAALNRPRLLSGNHVWKTGKLTIAAGAKLSMDAGATFWIEDVAAIEIAGTKDKPVMMTGKKDSPGYWRAFAIASTDPTNKISYLQLAHGASDSYYTERAAGLYLKGKAKVSVDHSSFTDTAGYGVAVENGATLTGFDTNAFSGNKSASLYITTTGVAMLDSATNYGKDGAADAFIEVKGIGALEGGTWPKTNQPLRLLGNHELKKGDFIFAAGVHLQLDTGASLWLSEGASLVAKGTKEAPIVIEGRKASAAYWKTFGVESSDPGNSLSYVQLRHAGSDTHYTSAKAGLYLKGKAKMKLDKCTFSDNGETDLVVEKGATVDPADPTTANTFAGKVVLK